MQNSLATSASIPRKKLHIKCWICQTLSNDSCKTACNKNVRNIITLHICCYRNILSKKNQIQNKIAEISNLSLELSKYNCQIHSRLPLKPQIKRQLLFKLETRGWMVTRLTGV